MDETDVAFDAVLEQVGNDGKFQKRFNFIFNMCAMVCASMSYMNLILAVNTPDHNCRVPGMERYNVTDRILWRNMTLPKKENNRNEISYDSCNMYNLTDDKFQQPYSEWNLTNDDIVHCIHGYDYDHTYYEKTPVTEYDWVCDKSHQETNVFVMVRCGEIFGTFIFGQLGDTLGRRPIFYICIITIILGRLICMFSAHIYIIFAIGSFLGSLTSFAIFQSPLIIGMEISKSDDRASISMKQYIGWTIGMILLPLIFWWTKDWYWFLMISTLPLSIFLCFPKYLVESPRWLATKGHYERAVVQLNRIAKINGVEKFNINAKMLKNMLSSHKKVEHVYGMASLFNNWRIAKNAILVTICWAVCNVTYFTLVLNSSRMDGNPFLNFLWQSAIELPAYILGQYLGDSIGRRFTNVIAFGSATLLCVPITIIIRNSEYEMYSSILAVLVKFCISITFFAVNLHAIEIYPTCLRQTGLSFGAVLGNLLGILGPYIVKVGQDYDLRFPFFVIGIMALSGSIACLFLPETLHQNLPETLEEATKFGKNQAFWSLPKRPTEVHLNLNEVEKLYEQTEEDGENTKMPI